MNAVLRRFPHALAAALCLGLGVSNAVRAPGGPAVVVAVACALLACALASGRRERLVLLAAALAVLGWWWGSVRLAALDASVLAGRVGEGARAVAVVTGPARSSRFAVRAPGVLERFGEVEVREPVLLELPVGRSPPQGARLELIGRLEEPRGSEGGFDERARLRRQGVHVILRGSRWHVVGHRGGVGAVGDRLRAHLARTLAPGLDSERRGVLAGIVLGADEGLEQELRDDFRDSGLYHLLAVSGQNVGLLAGGVLLLAWLLGIPRWIGELGALAGIGSYVLAVGLQPSVVRAGVAGGLASLAWLAARPRDRWYFLLVGATALLAWNPYNLAEPGFQLSFAAVASIFVAVPRVERRLEGYPLPRWLAGAIAVSVACGLATAPILWLHFGTVPVYSVLSNAMVTPAVPALLGLALIAALLEPVLPGAAAALVWLAGWLAAYIAACARAVGALPHASVGSPAALLGLAGVAAFFFALARMPPRRRRHAFTVAGAALALVAGFRLQGSEPPPAPQGLRITVLDVGQGDGILLQTSEHAVLVDQGPPEADVARQLRRYGVRRLTALVLTHPQRDHIGGAANVLRSLPVRFALDPQLVVSGPEERDALEAARARGVPVLPARRGAVYHLGRLRLEVLWPEGPGPPGANPNDYATVLLASYGSFDALLTADAESNVTVPLRPPQVELLKVAHHGSADPSLSALLELTRPRAAVISVGAGNDYGHPRASTIAALRRAGPALYRTDRNGAITIESDGIGFLVREERE